MGLFKSFSLVVILFSQAAFAGDFSWSGTYRAEGLRIENSELDSLKRDKAYVLHHLVLRPTIVAYDGLNIYGRFDILNGAVPGANQMGSYFGNGVNGTPTAPGSSANSSNALSQNVAASFLQVNELYMTYAHEYGVFTAGRAPVDFGLGLRFNNGDGMFDHWFDNRDMVAYKFITGNLFFMPVLAKAAEGSIAAEDDVNDYMFQLGYDNAESDSAIGLIYQARRSTPSGNDAPASPVFGDVSPAVAATAGFNGDYYNLYFMQKMEEFTVAFEVGFSSGSTGVKNSGGTEVSQAGQGMVVEANWKPTESAWSAGLKLGWASGDDPSTTDTFEGYLFDPNYDVAMLMMNHRLGNIALNPFQSKGFNNLIGGGTTAQTPSDLPDVEVISNAFFISADVDYSLNEQWGIGGTLAWASLQEPPVSGGNTDVGFELDLELNFSPFKGVKWINRAGLFFPGSAFEGANGQFESEFAYGLETKAAISF